MVELTGMLCRLVPKKILVAGDFMLDTYTIGKVNRISPEAPVSVLQVEQQEHRPGGTGNVILNINSLGSKVVALGRLGPDAHGQMLLDAFVSEGVDIRGLFLESHYSTPVKNRIIAENQQIVRVDFEKVQPLSVEMYEKITSTLDELLEGVSLITLSDYAKGFLSKELIAILIEAALQRSIPVIVDPKGMDFSKYQYASVIKPNLSEAYSAAGFGKDEDLDKVASQLFLITKAQSLLITRSELGVSVFESDGGRQDFCVDIRQVRDVTGAGDTVLAILAVALANGLTLQEAAQLGNIAAGIAIEQFGCARVSLGALARRLLESNADNKVFDEQHLFPLQEALKGRYFILLAITRHQKITATLFRTLRELAQKAESSLVIYLKERHSDPEFISLLASLREVDYIIVNQSSLGSLCEKIHPSAVYEMCEDVLTPFGNLEPLLAF